MGTYAKDREQLLTGIELDHPKADIGIRLLQRFAELVLLGSYEITHVNF